MKMLCCDTPSEVAYLTVDIKVTQLKDPRQIFTLLVVLRQFLPEDKLEHLANLPSGNICPKENKGNRVHFCGEVLPLKEDANN